MGRKETSQQLNLTLQRNNKIILILIGFGLVSISVILLSGEKSCGVQHIMISNDLKTYESSLDPEYCEDLLERIDSFNLQCEPKVEILDCG